MKAADVLKMIKDKDVKFVDLRFTDTKGKMQHVTADASCIDDAVFAECSSQSAPGPRARAHWSRGGCLGS